MEDIAKEIKDAQIANAWNIYQKIALSTSIIRAQRAR